MLLDASLAAISAVECLMEGISFADRTGVSAVVAGLFGLAVGSVLLLRRRWPVAVVLVAIAVTPAQMGILLGIVGLYTLAASDVPRRITGVLAGMSVAGTLIVTLLRTAEGYDGPFAAALFTSVLAAVGLNAPPVLLGLYIGARRRLVESLRERADGLERELSLLAEKASERAERARIEERTRIAREMHDVVAHRVSLMVVHASALKAVALRDPQRAAENAELLGDMGRQALNELRQMLGVLRTEPKPVLLEADGEGDGPCLDELDALVEESRAVGMSVEFTVEGARRSVAARIESTVYRVVQEALTNVHKHAPGAKTQVRLAYRDAELAVLVLNGPCDAASDGARCSRISSRRISWSRSSRSASRRTRSSRARAWASRWEAAASASSWRRRASAWALEKESSASAARPSA
jgi:signal transduction histidine kinase